jgi:hypothetical protein
MTRVQDNPYLANIADQRELVRQLTYLHRDIITQLNLLSEGSIQAATNAATAAPTTGDFQLGDFVRNSTPSELGAPGAKYLLLGWCNVAAGSPGTFMECRVLTGN